MESVEWHGMFSIWDYSFRLRTVVYKLASIRLSSCTESAQVECIAEIRKIKESTFLGLSPLKLEGDMMYETVILESLSILDQDNLGLPNQSVFDGADKFEFIKDYSPSVMIGAISFLGYRSLSTGILRLQSASVIRVGRLLFTGLAIFGIGMIVFKLADMKKGIQKKVTEKLTEFFVDSRFVESHSMRVAASAGRIYQSGVYDLQRKFQVLLDRKEGECHDQKETQAVAEHNLQAYETLQGRAVSLQQQLVEIDVD